MFLGAGDLIPDCSFGIVGVVLFVKSLRVEVGVGVIGYINEGNSDEGNFGVGKGGG